MILDAVTVQELIIAICGAITGLVTVIPGVVGFVMWLVNTIKNRDWAQVKTAANTAMRSVEAYAKAHPGELSSEQKLDMALQMIEDTLTSLNIKFDAKTMKRTIAYIKESISWFNDMNA